MSRALVTDLYELNMAVSYLRRGMDGTATFSLFVRDLPSDRGFLVAAGLEACLDYLESWRLTDDDLAWLRDAGFTPGDCRALSRLHFTGDVHAVAEGRIVTAGEPLLEVTAPLPEAQLAESYLLNQITYQSALASKAVRCRLAAPGLDLVDFSLRRTHGVEASMAVARSAAIAGFVGTSNVEAARVLGLRALGTMAHSYVEAFPTEADAFRAFAEDRPGPYAFLVDTYDTPEGVRTAARLIAGLRRADHPGDGPFAIRLDSGDLASLATEARRILDDAGLDDVRIFVSGALDEHRLEALATAGAPVDAAGIGTRLGVSADAPYLDSVYKLVSLDGRPLAKRSPGKETLPGAKQVWRRLPDPDLLSLRGEDVDPGREPLLQPVMADGRRLEPRPSTIDAIDAARHRLERDLATVPAPSLRITGPLPLRAARSAGLEALAAQVFAHGS